METLSSKESCNKFNKALLRYSHQKEHQHLLKYFPKYYNHLSIRTGKKSHLFSRIKRIKTLQKFTTVNSEKKISEGLYRTLLGNHRKNMKEIPQIISESPQTRLKKLSLWKIKSFPSITRLFFPRRKDEDSDDFLVIRKSFMRYLRNMRRLRILEIILKDKDSQWMKWMEEKLNGMQTFLERLKALRIEVCDQSVNIQEVFKNKDLMAQLTDLQFSFGMMEFSPSLMIIPEICKNLRFFGMSFECYFESDRTRFENFMNSMKELPKLSSLGVDSSLLPFNFLKQKSSSHISKHKWNLPKQLPKRWIMLQWTGISSDIIKELDEIEINIACRQFDDLAHYKRFVSMVLGRARKLRFFKYSMQEGFYREPEELVPTDLPFIIDCLERCHPYENIERFEYSYPCRIFTRDDLKELKKFKNLKILKLEAYDIDGDIIVELLDLLQRNQREGDYSMLQLKSRIKKIGSKWFEDIICSIRKAKDHEKSLKIVLDFKSPEWWEQPVDEFHTWETFADLYLDDGVIKGLFAHFWLSMFSDEYELLEIFDGRVKVPEEDRDRQIYQDPKLYII